MLSVVSGFNDFFTIPIDKNRNFGEQKNFMQFPGYFPFFSRFSIFLNNVLTFQIGRNRNFEVKYEKYL